MISLSWAYWVLLGIAFGILGLLSALHTLAHVRTSQGTIAWCLGLIAFPMVAVPLYWVFGRTKFHEYRQEMRRVWSERDDLMDEFHETMETHRCGEVVRQPVFRSRFIRHQRPGHAVLRGVDVRILLPSVPDILLVYLASFDFLRQRPDRLHTRRYC